MAPVTEAVPACPVAGTDKAPLVAQNELTEWTPDGHLRHSSFVGLRDDRGPSQRLTGIELLQKPLRPPITAVKIG